jgi:DNA-directed RNA polymerase subunit beta'
MMRELLQRQAEEAIRGPEGKILAQQGETITAEHIESFLNANMTDDMMVRKNAIKGIDVVAVFEEEMKEPLTRRLVVKGMESRIPAGRYLVGEEIHAPKTRKVLAEIGQPLTEEVIRSLAGVRDEIRVLNLDMVGRKSAELVFNSDGKEVIRVGEMVDEEAKKQLTQLISMRGAEGFISLCSNVIEPLRDRIVGRIAAENIVDQFTGELLVKLNEEIDEELAEKVAKIKERVSIRSVLSCKCKHGVCVKCYARNLATSRIVDIGEAVGIIAAQSIGEPGTQLTMRTFHTGGVASTGGQSSSGDITSGLPRVEELFEARKPKHPAVLAEVDGRVELRDNKGARRVFVMAESGEERIYPIPYNSRILVREGQGVEAGDRLTDGPVNPHDILRIRGMKDTYRYIVNEVQKVYKEQGVEINDKHIEVMVRQMLHKVKVEEPGDTDFLPGEYIDINTFEEENLLAIEKGGEPAVARPILLGITKASLATDSFLSAASFQETTRVLTDAAIKGKIDPLLGLKENVIIGKLIPAGTGMSRYRNIRLKKTFAETEETLPT